MGALARAMAINDCTVSTDGPTRFQEVSLRHDALFYFFTSYISLRYLFFDVMRDDPVPVSAIDAAGVLGKEISTDSPSAPLSTYIAPTCLLVSVALPFC